MKNPWLQIPASDYELHMALPEVAQAQALNELMATVLREHTPESVAVIGCTTGNGLEHVDATHTRRVVGVDINPAFLSILERRFSGRIPGLELVEADCAAPGFCIDPVSMVFAGLVFEYVDVAAALNNISRSMLSGAILVAVLQLPSAETSPVTLTRYESLECLASLLNLVSPSAFSDMCSDVGLRRVKTDTIPLKKGKAFFVGHYRKTTARDGAADANEPRC